MILGKRCIDLLKKARNNPAGLRFTELCKLCECVTMHLNRVKGSHHIYKSADPFKLISIQKMPDGKAKSYQVRQLLDFIEEHNL